MEELNASALIKDVCGNHGCFLTFENVTEETFNEAITAVTEGLEKILASGITKGSEYYLRDKTIREAYMGIFRTSCERLKKLKYPEGVKEASDIMLSLRYISI